MRPTLRSHIVNLMYKLIVKKIMMFVNFLCKLAKCVFLIMISTTITMISITITYGQDSSVLTVFTYAHI